MKIGLSTLTVLLVLLKLAGAITWSWWLVLIPIIIPFSVAVFLLGAAAIIKLIEK